MRLLSAAVLLGTAFAASAQITPEIQRSIIQRDQQSAEFAARTRGADSVRLEQLHSRQLLEITTQPQPPELHPYQRQKMADERLLVLPPPVRTVRGVEDPPKPLPLPGGPSHVVDPIPVQSVPN